MCISVVYEYLVYNSSHSKSSNAVMIKIAHLYTNQFVTRLEIPSIRQEEILN